MVQSADSGPLALPRRDRARRRWARSADGNRASPRTPSVPDISGSYQDTAALSHHAAEVAQARVFDRLLRAEISQLEQLVKSVLDRGRRPGGRDIGDGEPTEELAQLRARIDEAHRLLETLRRRFIYRSGSDGPGGEPTAR